MRAITCAVISVFFGCSSLCSGQSCFGWTQIQFDAPRVSSVRPAVAWDPISQRMVLSATGWGTGTWGWDGSRWATLESTIPWYEMDGAAAATFPNGVILTGGCELDPYGAPNDKVWRWDGSSWSVLAKYAPESDGHGFAYHEGLGVGLVFGTANGKPWTVDQQGKITVLSTGGPANRSGCAMAYHPGTQKIVMYGGFLSDFKTWGWDGQWSELAQSGPPIEQFQTMACDRNRDVIVLYTGDPKRETWEWNGTTWSQVGTNGPAGYSRHTLAYDEASERVFLVQGQGGSSEDAYSDWAWDGSIWTKYEYRRKRPYGPLVTRHALEHVPYYFDGELWKYEGDEFVHVPTVNPPQVQFSYQREAFVYDPARDTFVLVLQNQTWELTGNAWTQVPVTTPKEISSGVYDPRGQRVLAVSSNGLHAFDGISWKLLPSAGGPPWYYEGAEIAYDEARGVAVVTGGVDFDDYQRDVYEFDGATWRKAVVPTSSQPGGRTGHAFFYDPYRRCVVMHGGNWMEYGGGGSGSTYGSYWLWNGSDWKLLYSAHPCRTEAATTILSDGSTFILGGAQCGYQWCFAFYSGEIGAVTAVPVILQQPSSTSVPIGGSFSLSIEAEPGATLRWFHKGKPLDDGARPWGSVVSGAKTGQLQVTGAALEDLGEYTCSVFSTCGHNASDIVVVELDNCYGDCDKNTEFDFFDFLCFINAYVGGDPQADCDGDGMLTVMDFSCFQNAFASGCP